MWPFTSILVFILPTGTVYCAMESSPALTLRALPPTAALGVGWDGVVGLAGVTGVAGLAGVTGVVGLAGVSGVVGLAGVSGVVGWAGVVGVVGLVGVIGLVGLISGPLSPLLLNP